MRKLPHGWTETYTIQWLFDRMNVLLEEVHILEGEVSRLAQEVSRLDAEKASKRGPKPKAHRAGSMRVDTPNAQG